MHSPGKFKSVELFEKSEILILSSKLPTLIIQEYPTGNCLPPKLSGPGPETTIVIHIALALSIAFCRASILPTSHQKLIFITSGFLLMA
jgi:hypothetical protein